MILSRRGKEDWDLTEEEVSAKKFSQSERRAALYRIGGGVPYPEVLYGGLHVKANTALTLAYAGTHRPGTNEAAYRDL